MESQKLPFDETRRRWASRDSRTTARHGLEPALPTVRSHTRSSSRCRKAAGRRRSETPATRSGAVPPEPPTYGTLYGMEKTTVYVPPEVKRALGRLASARGTSEAELIREALRKIVAEAPAPRPRLPLIESGKPMLAERLDEALEGFGSA